MKFLLALFLFSASLHAQIYDCFIFYNELDLLEIRLYELYDHVDHFVIVESCETFKGAPKPFYFEESKGRFAPFLDKIIHVKLEERINADSPWTRERFQRNQIARGLVGCSPDDIIIVSDADEILRGGSISKIKEELSRLEPPSSNSKPFVISNIKFFWFWLNRPKLKSLNRANDGCLLAPMAFYYKSLQGKNIQHFRVIQDKMNCKGKHYPNSTILQNAGWHFSWLGGLENFYNKMNAYSHEPWEVKKRLRYELGNEFKDTLSAEEMRRIIEAGPFIPVNEEFPKLVRENKDHYIRIGLLKEVP
jgi:beta-1,4-mannosyl-glycoprotein beta-1,4-N-acetylglucosaminyltransferase